MFGCMIRQPNCLCPDVGAPICRDEKEKFKKTIIVVAANCLEMKSFVLSNKLFRTVAFREKSLPL